MTALCLPCWRQVVKSSSTTFEDPYEGWPPIKLYPGGHLNLEFGPFLLADHAIMDSLSYERLTRTKASGLEHVIASLKALRDNGYLQLNDYKSTLASRKEQIITLTNKEILSPRYYQAPLKESVDSWDSISSKYAAAIKRPELIATTPLGFVNALMAEGTAISESAVNQLRRLIIKQTRLTRVETETFSEIVRPYLEHVYTNLALSKEFDSPVFDWANTGPMYNAALYSAFEKNRVLQEHIPKVRELFSLSLSRLEPSTVDECIRVLNDKRVKEFRRFIVSAAENKVVFDQNFAEQLLLQTTRGNRSSRVGTTINFISTVASIATTLFDPSGTAASVLLATGSAAGQQVMGGKLYDIAHRDLGWLLCLADAKTA